MKSRITRRELLIAGMTTAVTSRTGGNGQGLPALLFSPNDKMAGGQAAEAAEDTLAPYVHPPLELSDDFDGVALSPLWRVVGVNTYVKPMWGIVWGKGRECDAAKVSVSESRLHLTGRNDRTSGVCLYGVYGGRKRLASPWAMEAVLELPEVDFAKTPVRAGITVRAWNENGWVAYVEGGRVAGPGLNKSFLFHEGDYQEGWTGKPEIETAQRVYLRIESADRERRAIRCGMKARVDGNWKWSPVLQFSQPILWLDNLQLMNFDVRHGGMRSKPKGPIAALYSPFVDEELKREGLEPTDEAVTIAFDAAQFEGKVLSLKEGIEYIRGEVPKIEIGSAQGERYEALVPDTLDLEERGRLAIHALTSNTDPNADHEVYWWGDFTRRPPALVHELSDASLLFKFCEALLLLRMMTGSEENRQVDQRWSEVLLRMQGPDGLLYGPMVGRPWAWDPSFWDLFPREEHCADPIYVCPRALGVTTILHFQDRNPIWREASEKLLNGLRRIIVDKGSYAYLPFRLFAPEAVVSSDNPPPPPGTGLASIDAWVILGLVKYYRFTGSEWARMLASKLVVQLKDRSGTFDRDGDWAATHDVWYSGRWDHFHSHSYSLLALVEYALATDSHELLPFCMQSYEYGKRLGNPLVGFFPEWYRPDFPTVELCNVADMLAIGCKLAAAGVLDCWEDVDRWVRNQFAESQMTSADWVYDHVAQFTKASHSTLNETAGGAAERLLGAFASMATGNDFMDGSRGPFGHCCTANSTRAIYYVWEHILRHEGDRVRVNLLLNRTSPWLDMDSYIPYEGKVELKMKQAKRVSIRIPAWTDKQHVECRVDGQPRRFIWSGQYLDVGQVNTGQTVAVEFPIAVRMVETTIGNKQYKLRIKGNDVVDIKPEGTICPLYQRDHYWHGPVRYKNIIRFYAQRTIDW